MNFKNINFTGRYHFLQNQNGLPCAYCGKLILTNSDIKKLARVLETKKGPEIADVLEPYVDIFQGKGSVFIKEMVEYARLPQYRNWKFKQLSMLGSEPKIYDKDVKKTLENLFDSIKYSIEHTTPKSKNGLNRQTNYLPMHIYCNNNRKSENYAQLSLINPDFVDNIRKSLSEIKYRVESDKAGLTHYKISLPDNYFDEIKENIEKQGLSKELFLDI